MIRSLVTLFAVVLVLLSVHSCRKIREDNLVKGLWQLQAFKIDTLTLNNRNSSAVRSFIDTATANGGDFLHALLPGYSANKAEAYYRIKFERDDISFSYYNIGDSNIYTTLGRWDLPKAKLLYQKSDNFIDGFFDVINKGNANEYEFVSELNYIRLLDDTVKTTIKIKRVK